MEFYTIIHSNGSKWAGEAPDSIDTLINILKSNTIEELFFSTYVEDNYTRSARKKNHCPISIIDGVGNFFGNFEELSHVFRITSNDPVVIAKLTKAIKANKGWEKYYKRNLV